MNFEKLIQQLEAGTFTGTTIDINTQNLRDEQLQRLLAALNLPINAKVKAKLKKLVLSNKQIVRNNKFAQLELSDFASLKELEICFVDLQSLRLINMPKLRKVIASYNNLTATLFENAPELFHVDLSNNPELNAFDAAKHPNISILYLIETNITVLDLTTLKHICVLDIHHSPVATLLLHTFDFEFGFEYSSEHFEPVTAKIVKKCGLKSSRYLRDHSAPPAIPAQDLHLQLAQMETYLERAVVAYKNNYAAHDLMQACRLFLATSPFGQLPHELMAKVSANTFIEHMGKYFAVMRARFIHNVLSNFEEQMFKVIMADVYMSCLAAAEKIIANNKSLKRIVGEYKYKPAAYKRAQTAIIPVPKPLLFNPRAPLTSLRRIATEVYARATKKRATAVPAT